MKEERRRDAAQDNDKTTNKTNKTMIRFFSLCWLVVTFHYLVQGQGCVCAKSNLMTLWSTKQGVPKGVEGVEAVEVIFETKGSLE